MANSRSALKRVRKTGAQTLRNKMLKSRVKTSRKKVQAAIDAGDGAAAKAAFQDFTSIADKAGRKNVIHPNAASRLKGILMGRVKALG